MKGLVSTLLSLQKSDCFMKYDSLICAKPSLWARNAVTASNTY